MSFNFFFAELEVSEPDLVVENVEREYVIDERLALRVSLRSTENLMMVFISEKNSNNGCRSRSYLFQSFFHKTVVRSAVELSVE